MGANCVWGQNANAGFRFNYKVINEAKRWVELSKCTYSGSETEANVVIGCIIALVLQGLFSLKKQKETEK